MPPIAVGTRVEMGLAEQHTDVLSMERKWYVWRRSADLPTFCFSGVLVQVLVLKFLPSFCVE